MHILYKEDWVSEAYSYNWRTLNAERKDKRNPEIARPKHVKRSTVFPQEIQILSILY